MKKAYRGTVYSGLEIHRPLFRRTLQTWLNRMAGDFLYPPRLIKTTRSSIKLGFQGLAQELSWRIWLRGSYAESEIYLHLRDGSYFDLMYAVEAIAQRAAGKRIRCVLCQSNSHPDFLSVEDMWIDHLFESIQKFTNGWSASTVIGLWGIPDCTSWGTQILKEDESLTWLGDGYIATFSPVLTGPDLQLADANLMYATAAGDMLANRFPAYLKSLGRQRRAEKGASDD